MDDSGIQPAKLPPNLLYLKSFNFNCTSLSYRDVEELVSERGLAVDHTTIWRWVQRYAPELNRRCRRELKPTNGSWRVDETYIRVAGQWNYLYRAVDSAGAPIDF